MLGFEFSPADEVEGACEVGCREPQVRRTEQAHHSSWGWGLANGTDFFSHGKDLISSPRIGLKVDTSKCSGGKAREGPGSGEHPIKDRAGYI